ncbi:MAG: hypothetical protein GXY51_05655 [Bacteroidetes bacterium]|jgi:hypothetical protein|nr:hypothetical protein [Bacteroidota bacterium]
MSKSFFLSVLSFSLIIILFAGCSKEGGEVYNIFSVEGCSIEEYNADYLPETVSYIPSRLWKCENVMYRTNIQISLYPSAAIILEVYNTSAVTTIPEGTFTMGASCNEGFTAGFYPNPGGKTQGLSFSAGSLTIEKRDGDYYIAVNLSIEQESGGGNLIGNFKGVPSEMTSR